MHDVKAGFELVDGSAGRVCDWLVGYANERDGAGNVRWCRLSGSGKARVEPGKGTGQCMEPAQCAKQAGQ